MKNLGTVFLDGRKRDAVGGLAKGREHDIASDGCLREWAKQLGDQTAADLLQGILNEEKNADQVLSRQAHARCSESTQANVPADTRENSGRRLPTRIIRPVRVKMLAS